MNLEYGTSHANFANPIVTQAGFTYSMSANLVKIQDTGKGAKSVTNDIEHVLRKIEAWHQGSIAGYRIMYRDSEGYWMESIGMASMPGSSRFGRPTKPRQKRSSWHAGRIELGASAVLTATLAIHSKSWRPNYFVFETDALIVWP